MKKYLLLFLLAVSLSAATQTWKSRDSDGDTVFINSDGYIYSSGDTVFIDDILKASSTIKALYGVFTDSLYSVWVEGDYGYFTDSLYALIAKGGYIDFDSASIDIFIDDIEFYDDVIFDSTVTFLGVKSFKIGTINWGTGYIYRAHDNNNTDATHSFTDDLSAFGHIFNMSEGDSIHYDSLDFDFWINWDGTPDNTDTLIVVRTEWQDTKKPHSVSTHRDYQYDTITGDMGNDTLNYVISMDLGTFADSTSITRYGFTDIFVDVNSASSVDFYMTTPIIYGRQMFSQ